MEHAQKSVGSQRKKFADADAKAQGMEEDPRKKKKEEKQKMTDCLDCPDVEIHETGSTLWLSCRHVSGWRSMNSKCVSKTLRKEE